MTALPSSVKVGPYVYAVALDEAKVRVFEHEQRGHRLGYSDHSTLDIVLDPTLVSGRLREVLLHEVLHAVCCVVSAQEKLSEEAWLERTGPTLLAVLRENPELVSFLTTEGPSSE